MASKVSKSASKRTKKKRRGRKVVHRTIKETLKIGKETFVEATETLDGCYNRYKNDNYGEKPLSHISDNLVIK